MLHNLVSVELLDRLLLLCRFFYLLLQRNYRNLFSFRGFGASRTASTSALGSVENVLLSRLVFSGDFGFGALEIG